MQTFIYYIAMLWWLKDFGSNWSLLTGLKDYMYYVIQNVLFTFFFHFILGLLRALGLEPVMAIDFM